MRVAVAADTCVLLDYANEHEPTMDAVALIFDRLKVAEIGVPPTVIQELNAIYKKGEPEESRLALKAMQCMLAWRFKPFDLVAVGHGIVEQIGLMLRAKNILPDDEENDSFIISECALAGFTLLISRDGHMIDAQESGWLNGVLRSFDVDGDSLIIQSPSLLLGKFGGRR